MLCLLGWGCPLFPLAGRMQSPLALEFLRLATAILSALGRTFCKHFSLDPPSVSKYTVMLIRDYLGSAGSHLGLFFSKRSLNVLSLMPSGGLGCTIFFLHHVYHRMSVALYAVEHMNHVDVKACSVTLILRSLSCVFSLGNARS